METKIRWRPARRIIVALIVYGLSSFGILFSLAMTYHSQVTILKGTGIGSPKLLYGSMLFPFVWIFHLRLCVAWIRNQKINIWWSIIGAAIGAYAIFQFPPHMFIFAIPATLPSILFAGWLLHFQAQGRL